MTDFTARPGDRFKPPPLPRSIWLRVEIHFSAVLLFYGTIFGLYGLLLWLSGRYVYYFTGVPFTQKLLLVLPFILGPFVAAGLDWLRLMLLGWVTRKLGSMA